ncbi:unnamed protein product [Prorocentrum cordatum]|uniref:DJ-1/PfpI domain-containing protein n=1 Tax=Prorocentrum cordatum TaxID=2364126 RepID=A0ABN9Q7B2_9DINO|nr:unnamed protein product [Polarella glacialis]
MLREQDAAAREVAAKPHFDEGTEVQTAEEKGWVPVPARRSVSGPYYYFLDRGCTVTVCSLAGGDVPIDASSLHADFKTDNDTRMEQEEWAPIRGTPKLADQDPEKAHPTAVGSQDLGAYDILFFSGGHGTCVDFPSSDVGAIVAGAMEAGRVVAAVCHGPNALVQALASSGPAVKGRRVTCFSDAEEEAVGQTANVPFLLETRLRELGAHVEVGPPFADHSVRDGLLVTGQNPQSSVSCARLALEASQPAAGGKSVEAVERAVEQECAKVQECASLQEFSKVPELLPESPGKGGAAPAAGGAEQASPATLKECPPSYWAGLHALFPATVCQKPEQPLLPEKEKEKEGGASLAAGGAEEAPPATLKECPPCYWAGLHTLFPATVCRKPEQPLLPEKEKVPAPQKEKEKEKEVPEAPAAAAVQAAEPELADTAVTIAPIYRLVDAPAFRDTWKAEYEVRRPDCLQLAHCFSEDGQHALACETYADAAGALRQLAAATPLGPAAELVRLEAHGPAAELEQLRAQLGPLGCAFFATQRGFRAARPALPQDTVCHLSSSFSLKQPEEFKKLAFAAYQEAVAQAEPEGSVQYAVSFDEAAGVAALRQAYDCAEGLLARMKAMTQTFEAATAGPAELLRMELHGPPAEVEKLRPALEPMGCAFYALERGFRVEVRRREAGKQEEEPPPADAAEAARPAGAGGAARRGISLTEIDSEMANRLEPRGSDVGPEEAPVPVFPERFFSDDKLSHQVHQVIASTRTFATNLRAAGPAPGGSRGPELFRVEVPRPYPGVQYRKSKDLNERHNKFAANGEIVEGIVEDDGEWLRISSDVYVPMRVGSVQILQPLPEKAEAPQREVPSVTDSATGGPPQCWSCNMQ